MGTRGREIVGENAQQIMLLLTKAFADEWLAYYQYWVGAKVVAGPMKDAVIAELVEHAADELRHAEMLAVRIGQLGGTPVLEPNGWYEFSNCEYAAPADPYVEKVVSQNLDAERCAIDVYNDLLQECREHDSVTADLAQQILQDELEHEDDLQDLVEDFELMKQHWK